MSCDGAIPAKPSQSRPSINSVGGTTASPMPTSRRNLAKTRPASDVVTGYRAPPRGAASKSICASAISEGEKVSQIGACALLQSSQDFSAESGCRISGKGKINVLGGPRGSQAQLHRVATFQKPRRMTFRKEAGKLPVKGDLTA